MATTQETIVGLAYFLSVYAVSFNVIMGLIGNLINILVFTQFKLFRRNQSAFYLVVGSIVDSCQLIFAALGFDLTSASLIWCKIRAYFAQFTRIVSIITICFAAIDQYLSTSYYIQLRRMSTFKLAQHLISILIIFSLLYSIPFLIFYEIRGNSICATFNSIFNYFYSFVHYCVLIAILPIFISSLFSLLAYQNVRHIVRRQMPIVRRRLNRQLTAMILLRVALFVTTTLPYTIFRIYQINSSVNQKNTYSVAVYELISVILIIVYNINYSGSFFVFLISSNRFRRQLKYVFYKKMWRKCLSMKTNRNQISPENQLPSVESNRSNPDAD